MLTDCGSFKRVSGLQQHQNRAAVCIFEAVSQIAHRF